MTTKAEIEANVETIKMWTWLTEHPTEYKPAYFRQVLDRHTWRPLKDCYLCGIWCHRGIGGCWIENGNAFGIPSYESGCPLDTRSLHCSYKLPNPYNKWLKAVETGNTKEATKQALRIVRACKRWLKKHGEA